MILSKKLLSISTQGESHVLILVNAFICRFQLQIAAMRSLVIFCRRQLFAFVSINYEVNISDVPSKINQVKKGMQSV